jgi:transcriptional regulator with XRE-family HTH domain
MPRKAKQTPDTETEPFPATLRKELNERKMSQADLAKNIGVARQTVSLYCTGQSSPDTNILRKIADYLNVSADYLLGRTDNKTITTDMIFYTINKVLGLSEKAITALSYHAREKGELYKKCLSSALSTGYFYTFVDCIGHLIEIEKGVFDVDTAPFTPSAAIRATAQMNIDGLIRFAMEKELQKPIPEPSIEEMLEEHQKVGKLAELIEKRLKEKKLL